MELALSIALVAGVFLFVVGLLIVVWNGFKHHFFTGIIALIPFVNMIILPTVWHRAYIGFYFGLIGCLLALGAWYGGGDQYLQAKAQSYGVNLPFVAQSNFIEQPVAVDNSETGDTTSGNTAIPATPVANVSKLQVDTKEPPKPTIQKVELPSGKDGELLALPENPLYKLDFQTAKLDDVQALEGEYVRITQTNGKVLEGKVTQSESSVLKVRSHGTAGISEVSVGLDAIQSIEALVRSSD